MAKNYDIINLLKPVRLSEQEEQNEESEEIKDNGSENEEPTNDKVEEPKDNKSEELKSDDVGKSAVAKKGLDDKKKEAQNVGKTVMSTQDQFTNVVNEIDALYKNNYLEKYGKEMKTAYNATSASIKKAMGIGLAVILVLMTTTNIIPVKTILPKIPILGQLFSGSPQAMMQARMLMSSCTYPITSAVNMKISQTVSKGVNSVVAPKAQVQQPVKTNVVAKPATTVEPKTTKTDTVDTNQDNTKKVNGTSTDNTTTVGTVKK